MKVCLAGTGVRGMLDVIHEVPFVLESFAYFQDWQKEQIKTAELFLLDSGAFTFLNSSKGNADFDKYLQRYIDFINENNIQYFFELDIDPIVGYEKVKEYRRKLERETGRQCIPVWHKSRGLDDFIETAKTYDYMAIGGIVTREIGRKDFWIFDRLLKIAQKHGCKVHGLGFTYTSLLPLYPFYSVDSTSWVSGARFGSVYRFDGRRMIAESKKDRRTIEYLKVDAHNLREWIKFQKFADCYL